MKELKITIKCFYNCEDILIEELASFGYTNCTKLNRAVSLTGTWKDVYFLNMHIRCGLSVLIELASFYIKQDKDLYERASKIKWSEIFDETKTFAVKGAVFSSLFNNSHYPFLLVKDAIVDHFRDLNKERPSISVKSPQVALDLYVKEKEVTLSLNTSGAPLYQRGYRTETGKAPINEVLAACLIRKSKWDMNATFFDPFCGSGTFLIEAGMLASGMPASYFRYHFAFKNFLNFDKSLWESLYNEIQGKKYTTKVQFIGNDISAEMISKAKTNARPFPFARNIRFDVGDYANVQIQETPGILLTNPPYGERLSQNDEDFYTKMGDWMKNSLENWYVWIISSAIDEIKHIGLKPDEKNKYYNGDLECTFRKFTIFKGTNKEYKTGLNT